MFSKYYNNAIINTNQTLFHDFFSNPNNPEELFTPLYLLHISEKCEIYKAIYNSTREIFCIKKFYSENFFNDKNSSKKFYDKIKEETSLMKSIKHCEYILQYHGSFFSFETKNVYLLYEYLEGGSVFDLGKSLNRNFTEEEIAVIINDILHGLIYLHQLNIVNRNIKITNILLTKEGNAKIGNFEKSIQKLNIINESKDYDETKDFKYDILLISITCLEMLICIKNNFERNKFIDQILKHSNKSLNMNILLQKELDKINSSQISEEFKDFLIKCLDPYPSKRPTAFELINHSFIKNNINDINKNNFANLVKNNIEKIENYKKLFYQNDNYKNIYNNLKKSSFYKSKKSNTKNTLKSQISLNEKSSINNTFDNKSNIDKLAEFRIEQMIKNEIIEDDKYINKDLYSNLDDSSILNTEKNKNFNENEKENNMDNSILKENDDLDIDIDFKSKWEHIKNFQDKLKLDPKFSENNMHYNYTSHFLKFDTQDEEEEEKYKSIKKSMNKCDIIKLSQNISHKSTKKINESSVFSLKNSIFPKNTNKKMILSFRNTIAFNINNDNENKISTRDESLISKNNNFMSNLDNRKSHTPFKHKKFIIEDNNEAISDGDIIEEYLYKKLDNLFNNEKNNKNEITKQKSEIIKINKLFNINKKKYN